MLIECSSVECSSIDGTSVSPAPSLRGLSSKSGGKNTNSGRRRGALESVFRK